MMVTETNIHDTIKALIAPELTHQGYRLVRVKLLAGRRTTLQIMIERLDDAPINLDDCTFAHRLISPLIDVADLIRGSYALELSSPGIDRPLTSMQDYQRFIGHKVRINLHETVQQRKRLRGRICNAEQQSIWIEYETDSGKAQAIMLDIAQIRDASLDPAGKSAAGKSAADKSTAGKSAFRDGVSCKPDSICGINAFGSAEPSIKLQHRSL
ncbi:MAG: ribosome maturation factor RimP [Pseudomonadota bacterium]